MGLFDDVHCRMDLPDTPKPCPTEHFQTKSFDCPYMDKYVIHEDGALTMNGEPLSFHGVVNFYAMQGHDWWEYDAKFTDGVCVKIDPHIEEPTDG